MAQKAKISIKSRIWTAKTPAGTNTDYLSVARTKLLREFREEIHEFCKELHLLLYLPILQFGILNRRFCRRSIFVPAIVEVLTWLFAAFC